MKKKLVARTFNKFGKLHLANDKYEEGHLGDDDHNDAGYWYYGGNISIIVYLNKPELYKLKSTLPVLEGGGVDSTITSPFFNSSKRGQDNLLIFSDF